MAVVFSNNAATNLASNVSANATVISVVDGSVFPDVSGSDHTYLTLHDLSDNIEIVKLTSRSGNTLTVERGHDSTSGRSFDAGTKCELRVTAILLNEIASQADTDTNTTYTAGSGIDLTGTEFTNSDPDQTVSLTGSGATTISGTYPNFTISSTDNDTVYSHPSAHSINFITGLQTALDGKVDDSQVLTNVPSGALFTDTNTVYTHPSAHPISFITGLQSALNAKVDDSQVLTNVPSGAVFTDTVYTLPFTDNSSNWNTAYGWGDHGDEGYATQSYVGTQITNLVDSSPAHLNTLGELATAIGNNASGVTALTTSIATKWTQDNTKISQWNTAYGWGNHADAGYLTSYTEADTLSSVTGRGATTSANISATSFSGASFGAVTGAPDSTIWAISRDQYPTYGIFYDEGNPDKILYKWAGATKFNINMETGALDTPSTVTASGGNSGNWNTAYGWGNHASQPYLRTNISQTITAGETKFNSGTNMATASGSQSRLEVRGSGSGNDAFMAFHVGGDYAAYFGLDGGTNKFSVGGWSMGAVSYPIYHEGNKPTLAELGYSAPSIGNGTLTISTNGSASGGGTFSANQSGNNNITITGATIPTSLPANGGNAATVNMSANRTDSSSYPIVWGTTGGTSQLYSCAATYIRSSDGTIFSTHYRGSGNVGGTGEASHHPAGIYSNGNNWLYGQIIMNNNPISGVTTINGGTPWTSSNDGVSSTLDAGLLGGNYPAHYLNYYNLSNRPTIGNGTFTINTSGSASGGGSFTANSITSHTITITGATIPTSLPANGGNSDTVDNLHAASFLRSDAADSFSSTITMATQKALVANNYGRGVYGVYSASRYQHIWSMGTSYSLADDGTSSGAGGNLYGLAFTYNPNYAYSGSNAQARSGLNHQMLLMMNGTSYAAIGNGMWTTGTISSNAQGTLWGSSNDGVSSTLDAGLLGGNYPSHYLNYNNLSNKPSIPTIPSSLPANGGNADTVDSLHAASFARSDTSDTLSGDYAFTGGHGAINITSSSIVSNASSNWTGNPGSQGKIQYHSNRWYIVSDSSSQLICQFRRDGADKSYIDNNGTYVGNLSGTASYASNSNLLDGLDLHNTQSTQNTANQVLRTQNNGYTMLGWINTTSGETTGMNRIYASNDGYIRYVTPATFGLGITPYINMPTTDTSWNYTGSAGKTSITGAIGTLGETQNAHAATQGSSNLRSVGVSHNGKVCQDFVEQTWTLTRAEYNNMTANQMFTMINLGTSRGSNPGRVAIVTELVLMLKYSNPISGYSALGSYSGESIQILNTNSSSQNKIGGFQGQVLASMGRNANARCEFLYQDRTYRRYWAEENIVFAKQDNSQLSGYVTHLCVKLRYKVYDGASF